MKSVEEMLFHTFGGCPKRNVCNLRQVKSKTCSYGPYTYCGKYRSVIAPKKREEVTLP
jgi:hypothetical protein